jgi:hypothetical protein
VNYVIRNGKRIEVETLEARQPTRRRSREEFAMVPLDWANAMTKATDTQRAFVGILLLYAAWRAGGKPFAFTNARLHRAKISSYVKRRTLDTLESAGLIEVERHPGRAPVITLKDPTPT